MTSDSSATVPASAGRVTEEQLAAVHALMGSDRRATEYDILISTILEALRDGAKPEAQIVSAAQRVWPGAGIDAVRIGAALHTAQMAGYIVKASGAVASWALTNTGSEEISSSRNWAQEALERTRSEIRDRLEQAGRTTDNERAILWLAALVKVISAGVRASLTDHMGEVEVRGETVLAPRTYDRDAVAEAIQAAAPRPDDAELLAALALDAFDPLSSFGNELVMNLTIGYMLHAFVARRDNLKGRSAIGSLRGDRAILDTPSLVPLLGVEELEAPIRHGIEAAIAAGMEVVVPQHYLDELLELLDRIEREDRSQVEAGIEAGVDPDLLAQVVDEPVVAIWLHAQGRGLYEGWLDFRAAAEELPERLRKLGVVVRDHHNQGSDNVDGLEAQLTAEIEARRSAAIRDGKPVKGRGKSHIRRDAETMAMARRRRVRSETGLFWPGAWIISTDTAMRRVYQRVEPRDAFPLTITPAQWVGIVSTCSDPATMEELAKSAASLLAEETVLSIAGGFPVSIALEVARALEPGGPIDTRLVQQLSVGRLLAEESDLAGEGESAAKIAAAVVARRSTRLKGSYEAAQERHRREVQDSGREVEKARAALVAEREERRAVERERDAEAKGRQADTVQFTRDIKLGQRRTYRNVAIFLAVLFLVWLVANQLWVAVLISLVGLGVFIRLSFDWTADIAYGTWKLAWSVAFEAAALVVAFISLWVEHKP